jgi:hypothetical protein
VTLTINVPDDLEGKLKAQAERCGMSLEEFALRMLKDEVAPQFKTGADIVAYWKRHDVIGSRPEIKDSVKHARKLRKKAERRSRK